uniref:Salivary secreted protein n=1 Tax=Anopheles stephensi TaxID=30069 RepID=A0A182YQI9_ANOST
MAFKVAAFAFLLVIAAIHAAPQLDQLPSGMTTPEIGEIQAPVGGNQTNPGDLGNNLNTTVPSNPAEGVGGAENATMPSNIGGGIPNQLGTRLANRINSRNNKNKN